MPKANNIEKEMLRELEKLVKRVIRKNLKDNTLDYTVQFTVSNLEPSQVKYAAQISSPAKGVQPITFVFDKFEDLKNSLAQAEKELNRDQVELVFHQNRINTLEQKVKAHKERMDQIAKGETEEDPDEDVEIPMEQV